MACFWTDVVNATQGCDGGGPTPDNPWEFHFLMRHTGPNFTIAAEESCGEFLDALIASPDYTEFRGNHNPVGGYPSNIASCGQVFDREAEYWVEDTIDLYGDGAGGLYRSVEYFGGHPTNYYNKVVELRVIKGLVEQTFYGFFLSPD